jgi:hypothetical protein
MAITQLKSDKPGVLMIGFIPVIREGLQAIMAKDPRLNVVGDVPLGYDALLFIKRVSDRGQTVNSIDRDPKRRKGWSASYGAYRAGRY